jgi:hypothetical protein
MQHSLELHLCVSRLKVIPSELCILLNETMVVG